MKVAIIHEFLVRMGGAERVLADLLEVFPEAKVYTLLYDEKIKTKFFPEVEIESSRVQALPKFVRNKYWLFVNRFSSEVENWDLSEFDLVISSSNSFTHGVITSSKTLHVTYYHSPTRYIWDWKNEYLSEKNLTGWKKLIVEKKLSQLRVWDYLASRRPDLNLANSIHVQKRIRKYYGKDSQVIYPPVDTERFSKSDEIENYYLIVSTLTPFKKVDLAVRAAKELGLRLKIVGDGKDRKRLEEIADGSKNIEFLGFCSDTEVAEMMSRCKGFVFCGEEDFGITPVEIMASGRPVLAYKKGGLLETIIEGETGLFFEQSNVECLKEGWLKFDKWIENDFERQKCLDRAKLFSKKVFKQNILNAVNKEFEKHVKLLNS